ncbi:hypothetical protein HWV00_20435 [Moritella sp. 24]|uniref:hypothetical protein n=1 Tax=Moritella sp. 24 TaxID=2746230 RepID=UPI001BA924C7|nr:hypothetical protein [Moritella sp. 24]QUM78386.1 hypothetical protein HWV00_20435 [Moritella sp. 24]
MSSLKIKKRTAEIKSKYDIRILTELIRYSKIKPEKSEAVMAVVTLGITPYEAEKRYDRPTNSVSRDVNKLIKLVDFIEHIGSFEHGEIYRFS